MRQVKGIRSILMMSLLIFLMTASYTNACWAYLTPEDLVTQADTIIVGVIEGKTGQVKKEGINEIGWGVQVKYYLKGTGEESHITVATPPENISTHYDLDSGGNEVLLFLNERDGYFTPVSPQGVVPVAFANEAMEFESITSGEGLFKQINILEENNEEAYRDQLTALLKELPVRVVELEEKAAENGDPQTREFKLAYLSIPGAILTAGLWAVLKK